MRFIDATEGKVKILTKNPDIDKVLYKDELLRLSQNMKNNKSLVTEVEGLSIDVLKKLETVDDIRNVVVVNGIEATRYSNVTAGHYDDFMHYVSRVDHLKGGANKTLINEIIGVTEPFLKGVSGTSMKTLKALIIRFCLPKPSNRSSLI